MRQSFIVALAVIAVAGCTPALEQPKSLLTEGCLLNSDCVEPLVCVYRRCHQPCTSARDCPTGSDCQVAEAPYAVCTQGDCTGKACPTGQSCGSDNQCHAQCVADGQCLAEQQCVAGMCVNRAEVDAGFRITTCRYDSECAPSPDVFIVCRPDNTCGPQCRDARDCAAGLSCSAGRCVATPGDGGRSCAYNSDCLGNDVCRQGACLPECLTARDCGASQQCEAGRCATTVVDGGAGFVCTYNSQCTAPLACVGGACGPACNDSRDCATGQVCQGGACVRPVGDGGATSCSYNSQCNVGQRCASGACIAECVNERDCASGFACVNSRCVPPGVDGGGALDGGSVCLLNSDCQLGFRCGSLGICIPECLNARDCNAGYDCVAQRCVPAGASGDAGLPTGFGTPCNFQSTCAPYNLVCGPSGACVYDCLADRDCATSAGFCCRTNHCVAGNACVVPVDAGVVDAGNSGGGCSADIQCLDADFCNGSERCVAGRCVAGTSPCIDNNPCTVDSCNNALRTCSYQTLAVDVDMDQHYPVACGGTADDCDDADALTFPGALERCDFKDNNCNGAVDEGLWNEEANARGNISTSLAYPPKAGPPAVHLAGNEVQVFAAAYTTTGALDAWRLSATDLSLIAGPVPVEGTTTSWTNCNDNSVPYLGRQIARPYLYENGDSLFVTARVTSYSSGQGNCCTTSEVQTSRVMGSQVTPSTFATPVKTTLATHLETNTVFACRVAGGDVLSVTNGYLDAPSAAWSAHLNKWITTWWTRDVAQDPYTLKFATVTSGGLASATRPVYDVPGSAPAYDMNISAGLAPPRVAVGANSVLFVWTNMQVQPYAGRFLRWVLFDKDLTSVIAGPFDFASFPLNGGAPGFLTQPKIDKLVFDGTNYVLTLNPQSALTTNIAQADGRVRLLTVNEQGAVIGNNVLMGSLTINSANVFSAGVQPSFVSMQQGKGMVGVTANGNNFRFGWASGAPNSPFLTVDVNSGAALAARTDAVLVPLSDTRVGLIWSDGDLKRTVMRCGP